MPVEPVIISRDHHCVSRSMMSEGSLKVLYRLNQHGYTAYLVGGSVRDLLLGRQPKDFDVGTNATPEQVHKLFRNCRLIGRRFRLAHIMFGRRELIEVATFRRKPSPDEIPDAGEDDGPSHFAENVFGTPEEDAFRRDFTINALFYDIENYSIVDYVGGLQDLHDGIIRVIGDPDERFHEDPVRMLRALEFASRLGFELEERIEPAIDRCAPHLLTASPARIREELMELFRHKVAGQVLQKAHRYGLLPYLVPDFVAERAHFDLIRQLDMRTASGVPIREYVALAAMYLGPFLAQVDADMSVGDVHKVANQVLAAHCRYFSIANGIRHQARELFIGFFRFYRGRGRRGEQRFLRHPSTAEAFELLQLWVAAGQGDRALVSQWQQAINGEEPEPKKPPRKRRPRRRKKRTGGGEASSTLSLGSE